MNDLPILGIGRWRLLHAVIVRTDGDGAGLGQELSSLAIQTGRIGYVCTRIRPGPHTSGPQHHDVTGPKLGLLVLQTALEIVRADPMAGWQHVDTMEPGHIEQYAAGDHGRMLIHSVYIPVPAPEMICRGSVVENLAVVAKVIQSIDVGAAVRVHRD